MDSFLDLGFQKNRLFKNIDSLKQDEKEKINRAYKLAKKYHSEQRRDEGTCYIIHPIRVASLLIEELRVKDSDVICASLLHDALEDTKLTPEEIKEKLGTKTFMLVESLTRKKLPDETKFNKYERKYENFKETMKKDWETRAIKACDYLDNMMSWPFIPKNHPSREKFPRWFREVETMYIPLARSVDKELVDKIKQALNKAQADHL